MRVLLDAMAEFSEREDVAEGHYFTGKEEFLIANQMDKAQRTLFHRCAKCCRNEAVFRLLLQRAREQAAMRATPRLSKAKVRYTLLGFHAHRSAVKEATGRDEREELQGGKVGAVEWLDQATETAAHEAAEAAQKAAKDPLQAADGVFNKL